MFQRTLMSRASIVSSSFFKLRQNLEKQLHLEFLSEILIVSFSTTILEIFSAKCEKIVNLYFIIIQLLYVSTLNFSHFRMNINLLLPLRITFSLKFAKIFK